MKNICKKITSALEWTIGISFALCLFLGGLGLIGFIAAFCAGGEIAEFICTFLSKTYYAYLIRAATMTTLLCFLLEYFSGNVRWVNPFKKKETASRKR